MSEIYECLPGWSQRDIVLLAELVQMHGMSKWTTVADHLRTTKSIFQWTPESVVRNDFTGDLEDGSFKDAFQPNKCEEQYNVLLEVTTPK